MIDVSSIQSAFGSLQTAGQIAKAILDLRDASLIREKASELGAVLIAAQSEALRAQADLSAAIDEIRQLKEQVMKAESWATEKERYALAEIRPGVFACLVKPSHQCGEPAHSLCAHCYERGIKSILQRQGSTAGQPHFVLLCVRCRAEVFDRVDKPIRLNV